MERRSSVERRRYWSDLIRRQPQSGKSVAAFCREHGATAVSFYQWRNRLASEAPQAVRAEVSFVPLPVAQVLPARSPKFTVRLPNRVQLTVPSDLDESALKQLLTVAVAVAGMTEHRDA